MAEQFGQRARAEEAHKQLRANRGESSTRVVVKCVVQHSNLRIRSQERHYVAILAMRHHSHGAEGGRPLGNRARHCAATSGLQQTVRTRFSASVL